MAKDYADIPKQAQRNKELENPYFNALQVKFAYAITQCHKSQGGQWENVFVEQGYFTSKCSVKNTLDGCILL